MKNLNKKFILMTLAVIIGILSTLSFQSQGVKKEVESRLENNGPSNQTKKKHYRHRFKSSNLC